MVDLTLSTTKVDSTQANYLAAVQHASESLLLIINDLLVILFFFVFLFIVIIILWC